MHAANGVDLDAPGGELRSLLLRATYTAEHEAGVDELQRDLGCDADRGPGLAARLAGPVAAEDCSLVTGHAEERFWVETPVRGRPGRTRIRALTQTTEYCALSLGRDHRHRDPDRLRARVAEIGRRYRPEDPVAGAWDWANCLIVGYGPGRAHVAALHAALQAGDLALWVGRPSDAPHHRAGLILARASRLDPTVGEAPWLDFSSGYVQRGIDQFPKQGTRKPWKLYQNYALDLVALRFGSVDDGVMQFSKPEARGRQDLAA